MMQDHQKSVVPQVANSLSVILNLVELERSVWSACRSYPLLVKSSPQSQHCALL